MTNVESTSVKDVSTLPERAQKWSELLAQVRADATLKRRFVDTPLTVLQERGIEVPKGMEIRVVENTDKVSYVTLPSSELSTWTNWITYPVEIPWPRRRRYLRRAILVGSLQRGLTVSSVSPRMRSYLEPA